jgi:hypothetical protein
VPSYQTPAGQRRVVDLTAPNGSASTIEANSNPPSSNAHHTNGRIDESESPVLQMKRAPADQGTYTETPGSNRNIGVPSREAYAMLSSPAAHYNDAPPEDQRWGSSIRPMNAGPASNPGPPGAGTARNPMAQRNGLGAVSVGSGGLFGR